MLGELKSDKKGKTWFWSTVLMLIVVLCAFASTTIYIDPFFHYHKPIESMGYPLLRDNERYQNDGILRHFDYDAIIIGTSMTENFKASECNALFDVTAVKVPLAGGLYKEINDNIERALGYNENVKIVIRSMDNPCLLDDKDATNDSYDYADYLTNQYIFDDVSYVLNKEVLAYDRTVLDYNLQGKTTTSFDDYANWMADYEDWFGEFYVVQTYTLGEPATVERTLSPEETITIQENIRQNVTQIAWEHPEVTFYVFIPPYSLGYWDELHNNGEINYMIDAQEVAIEEIVQCPNIKLFSFDNNFELVCNWDNYTDQAHYGEWVNTQILQWMSKDEYLLTQDNYEEYLDEIREFYNSYDYSQIGRVW